MVLGDKGQNENWYVQCSVWWRRLSLEISLAILNSAIWLAKHSQIINTLECRYNVVSFLKTPHKRHPIACPLGQDMGCLLWIEPLIYILSQSVQWCMQYHLILDCVIMAPDCSYETSKELCLTWWSSLCLLMAQYNYIKFRFRLACEHWRAEGSYMHDLFVYMYMYVCLCATNLFINVSSAILLFATNSKTYILRYGSERFSWEDLSW